MNTTIDNLNGILLRDIRVGVTTAGPSPLENKRNEVFLLGCKKAMSGNPCKGCFNETTWDNSKAKFSHDPKLLVKSFIETFDSKYITIGGGEPFDQMDNLIELCKNLKENNFNILVYTHYELQEILEEDNDFSHKVKILLNYIDILVDGEFIESEKMYSEFKADGFLSSIGSGNQIVWDINKQYGIAMRDIETLELDEKDNLYYTTKGNCTIYTF